MNPSGSGGKGGGANPTNPTPPSEQQIQMPPLPPLPPQNPVVETPLPPLPPLPTPPKPALTPVVKTTPPAQLITPVNQATKPMTGANRSAAPCPLKKHFVKVKLVFKDDQKPVPATGCQILLGTAVIEGGPLGNGELGSVTTLDAGSYEVTFPDIDSVEWDAA